LEKKQWEESLSYFNELKRYDSDSKNSKKENIPIKSLAVLLIIVNGLKEDCLMSLDERKHNTE
jgi:hypothetical protein